MSIFINKNIMKKKYFTEEEKKEARRLEAKKYYDKKRKKPLTLEEKEEKEKERIQKRKEYEKEYYKKNKEKILENSKKYFKENKEIKQFKNNKRYKERRVTDPIFRLSTNIKRNIRSVLKKNGYSKKSKTIEILGCSYGDFKQRIESLWLIPTNLDENGNVWMNWDNYGLYNGTPNYGWDIDHVIPSSSATTEEDVIKLNHYTNLQPLCSYINRDVKRGDNVVTVVKGANNISKISMK
jgi:hypothetical protein